METIQFLQIQHLIQDWQWKQDFKETCYPEIKVVWIKNVSAEPGDKQHLLTYILQIMKVARLV